MSRDLPSTSRAVACSSAAGTRQTDGLYPGHMVDQIQAVLLTGGSAYIPAFRRDLSAMFGLKGKTAVITGGGGDLFAPEAKLCPDQISEDAALAAINASLGART